MVALHRFMACPMMRWQMRLASIPNTVVLASVAAFWLSGLSAAIAQQPGPTPVARGSAVRTFLGPATGNYILPGRSVTEQVGEALSGPPDPNTNLPGGRLLVSGCRFQSCDEKAAVIFRGNTVEAVGLIHFGCHFAMPETYTATTSPRKRRVGCSSNPTLTAFVPKTERQDLAVAALDEWAQRVERKMIKVEILKVH